MFGLNLVVLAMLAGLGLMAKKAIELVLETEYTHWASALARLLVRLAGLMHRPQRGKWWADLLYVQRVEKESGLLQAASCFLSAPWLTFRDARKSSWARATTRSAAGRVHIRTVDQVPIEELELSVRATRPLKAKGILTVGQLLSHGEADREGLRRSRRLGPRPSASRRCM
jgi:hypothetical protein